MRLYERRSFWCAGFTACSLLLLCHRATEGGLRPLQIAKAQSELTGSAVALIGHWRKTTIVFESARDEHLVLDADGTAENWTVTASGRGGKVAGHWSVDGKVLTLSLGEGDERSGPFTIYQGQLVFPNISNRRKFWDRID